MKLLLLLNHKYKIKYYNCKVDTQNHNEQLRVYTTYIAYIDESR